MLKAYDYEGTRALEAEYSKRFIALYCRSAGTYGILIGMIKLDEFGIRLAEKGKDAHYTIKWSPLFKADRWTINAKVPSVAGIYEVYWMDDHEHLRMLSVGQTHYGGLRSELRRLTDPELNADARKTLEDEEIWCRYAPCNSAKMMADVIWFFQATYFPEKNGAEHSGRFNKIYLNESAPDKLIWVP